jgi:hypothetical protein
MKLHRILIVLGIVAVVGWVTLIIVQTGSARSEQAITDTTASLSLLYRFTGVTDDGQQGSTTRKEATSIHCTNMGLTNAQVEVQLYQWNGTDVYTGTVTMPPNRTFTFSTQNTTIYFDDVLLGGSPGTPAIFQGSGQIYADSLDVFCTVQALDPLNYPPTFVTKLPLFDQYGRLIKHNPPQAYLFLPIVIR